MKIQTVERAYYIMDDKIPMGKIIIEDNRLVFYPDHWRTYTVENLEEIIKLVEEVKKIERIK